MEIGSETAKKRPNVFKRGMAFVKDGVWDVDLGTLGPFRCGGVHFLRFFSALYKGFCGHPCGLHAAGLTYFSMLALVPILCLLMVLAKTCGAGDFARTKINEQIDMVVENIEKGQARAAEQTSVEKVPSEASSAESAAATAKAEKMKAEAEMKVEATRTLAAQVRTFSNDMFDRIDKFSVGTLGWIGFGMLMWTVVSTLGQVETAMNEIWDVSRARSIVKRFFLYLFTAVVFPLLVALAMSMPILRVAKSVLDATLGATSYTKWAGDALIALIDSRIFGICFTLLFASLAFAFVLKVIPNRRVNLRPALEGGVLTAVLFGGWFTLCTTAGVGIAKSSAMYGSFATFPIVLAWIYMSWQIVLLGSCMTYAFQCVHSRTRPQPVD